jgi:peptidyl-prolyl cis-trans isomerase D
MLDAMRRGAQSWVAKILFGILVISFAIWGVADVFRGWGQGQLATVGPQEITVAQFQQAYQNEMNAFANRLGKRLTPEQARQFGLDARVLARLIGASAIEAHTSSLGLAISNDTLAEIVRSDPTFAGTDGQFSRAAFDSILRQAGMSEGYYLDLRRKDELREEITNALTDGLATPPAMVDLLHKYREETRVIEHVTIDPAKAVTVPEPDEAKLKETYEQNKRQFMTPEYRHLAVLALDPAEIKTRMEISDDEIKAAYEQDRESYNTQERRRVQQISFPNREAADAAKKAIEAGQSFEDAAKAAGATEKDIELGLLPKGAFIDPKIAEAAFSLKEGQVSDVVEGRFTTVLLRVTGIEPGFTRTLDDVRDKVRDKLATDKATREVQRLHDEVDDGRAAARPLKEIAETLNVTFVDVPAVDRQNKTPEGGPAVALPGADKIVAAGFEAQVGVEHEVIELPGGGYAWVDVLGVAPESQKSFEAVQSEVRDVYFATERRRLLSEFAARLAERLRNGEPMATIAAEVGGTPETTLPVTRTTVPQGLTQAAVTQAFALPKGGAGSAETADGKSRTLFRVTEVTPPPPPTKEQAEQIRKELEQSLENDLLAQYVAALQDRLGVSVNEQMLRRATGSDLQQ